MALLRGRGVFVNLLLGAVCLSIGFILGKSKYGEKIVFLGPGQVRNGVWHVPISTNGTATINRTNIQKLSSDDVPQAAEKDIAVTENTPTVCNIHDIRAESHDRHECLITRWKPAFHICIHPINKDIYVSKSIKVRGIWEQHVLQVFQRLLRCDQEYGVIDIGANIGQYALMAAAMGRPVVAVEARLLHVEMIHHAVQLNGFSGGGKNGSSFVLLHNAVSDNHNALHLQLTEARNQGHTQVIASGHSAGIPASEVREVPAILMDDIAEVVHFEKALIKIDIEGFEHRAIAHCEKLLQRVYVPYMFMEWLFQKNMLQGQKLILDILTRNGYSAFALDSKPLTIATVGKWPTDIIWKHRNASFVVNVMANKMAVV